MRHQARDLARQAALRQEEEGGDAEEAGAEDDAGHGREVSNRPLGLANLLKNPK